MKRRKVHIKERSRDEEAHRREFVVKSNCVLTIQTYRVELL